MKLERYEVSYVEHGRAEVPNPFALKRLLSEVDDPSARLLAFEATRHDDEFRVSFRRRWAHVYQATSEVEALRSFLHISSLPETLNYRDVVVKKLPAEIPIEADDQRAGEAA